MLDKTLPTSSEAIQRRMSPGEQPCEQQQIVAAFRSMQTIRFVGVMKRFGPALAGQGFGRGGAMPPRCG